MASDGGYFTTFEESKVATVATVITVVCAASFLLGPIIALYYVQNSTAKLAMVVVLTTLFAAVLTLITTARRAEIFGATAA